MMTAFLFPGQGAQRPGMLHQLPRHEVVANTLAEVASALGEDVLNFDTAEAQQSTVATQVGLLAAGVATARYLQAQDIYPAVVLGMSVGAFAAAVIAGTISLHDAVLLVKERAERMQALFPKEYGMAAIVGLSESQVLQITESVYTEEAPVFVTNINAAKQIVTAGARSGLLQLIERAEAMGAQRAELLKVSVPSHCRLLEPVASALSERLQAISLSRPKCTYISNVHARATYTAKGVQSDLANNIAHGVRWSDATEVAVELGCDLFLEMQPGHTLTDLLHQAHPGVEAVAVTEAMMSRILKICKRTSDRP